MLDFVLEVCSGVLGCARALGVKSPGLIQNLKPNCQVSRRLKMTECVHINGHINKTR